MKKHRHEQRRTAAEQLLKDKTFKEEHPLAYALLLATDGMTKQDIERWDKGMDKA